MRRLLRPLDRYVLQEFLKILGTTALGFPVLVIVVDITESLDKYLNRRLPMLDIAKAYLWGVPETMFLVLPAAVLFATVFSIGAFTRHSEITAAKASGISFYRFIVPIAFGALLSTGLGLVLAGVTPRANATRDELLRERKSSSVNYRWNFTFASDEGRVYTLGTADVDKRTLLDVEVDRKGNGPDYPTYVYYAKNARYTGPRRGWLFEHGVVHVMPDASSNFSVTFDSLRDHHFREAPAHLMDNPRAPDEMGFHDLGVFIEAMRRSGTDVNKFRTARQLKLAIPVTCLIIMLFGAPLATTTRRGGAALGVGISLATTVVFLMLVQLTQAIGDKGLVLPELAAWLPSILFAVLGGVLLAKVRT